ncbi:MAG TPA: sialidase family protein, partial [Candidatus Nitrosopolaris sp.]|nr:sialidase family protein [Candidatus Nitrosopolaris sp.]
MFRATFAIFVVLIIIGIPEIIDVHAKLPNNIATVVSPLDGFKENSEFKNQSRQISNTVQSGNKTVNLSDTTHAFDPQMCVVAKNVYVIWENRGMGMSIVLFKRSIDNGATFEHAIRLSNSTDYSVHPEISASVNRVYVLWQRYNSGILLRKSTDNGTTFRPVVKVTDITGNAQDLQLATSGDNLYVLWKDAASGEILLKKSTNGGVGFGPATKLGASTLPDANLAAVGTNVYIVWDDVVAGNYNIIFKRSIDNGATFGPTISIIKNGTKAISNLNIAAVGTNVYIVWDDVVAGNYNILFKRSIDNGATFGQSVDLTEAGFEPHISISTVGVYVAWQDANSQGTGGISITRSTDHGATFGPTISIIKNATNAISNLNIATLGTNVYVAWQASSIILKRSTDSGATFGPAVDLSKYYEDQVNFNGVMDFQLVTSQENNDVYLGWNQPILSPVDNSSSLHSDVVFARVQPALFVQSSFYYNER